MANMLAGPLISVATEIAQRMKPGGLLLLSGFRKESLQSVATAFAPYFNMVDCSPGAAVDRPSGLRVAMEKEGWLAVEAWRSDAPICIQQLSESAVS